MGQKVNPVGFRLGIHKGWASNWFYPGKSSKDVPGYLQEDYLIRRYLKKELATASVSKFEISRKSDQVSIDVYTARPGVIVGKGGQGIDALHEKLRALLKRQDVRVNVLEVNRADAEAQLVAESIAQQLEKRVAFRRAMKQAMQRTMRSGALGIKIMVSGRLGGAEIARTEWSKDGRIPLQTLRADIDYGKTEANTMMGKIGVKVWIFRGELERGQWSPPNVKLQSERQQNPDGTRPERTGGGNRAGRSKTKKAG